LLTLPAREHASNTVGAGRDSPPPAAVARPAEPGTAAIPATQPPLHQVQHCCGTRQWRCSSGKIPGRRQPAPPWTPSPPGTIHSGPPNPTLHLMQLGLELEPGHQPTAAPSPPAPPRREARDELKPPAAFRVAARRTQLRRPRPGPVSDLDPDDAAPGPDRDRDRLPGSTRAGCRTLLLNISLTSKTATSPHGCPGPSTSETQARAARARSGRPASVTVSRTVASVISAHPPSRPPWSREIARAAGRTHRDGRPTRGQTSRPGHPRNGHRNPRQAATHTAPWPRFPSAMRPRTPQFDGSQRYKMAHGGTEKKRPASARIRS
jgi:hypothetical protein